MPAMRIGVIGLGFMGTAHVAAVSSYPNAQLAAVVTNNARAREGDLSGTGGNLEMGTRQFDFSQVTAYSEWQEMVADESIDAVFICLPTDLHSEVSIAALHAGKHVLCEKPMALTASECDRMLEAASQSGKTFMVAQVLRFWPEYQKLRDFVSGGQHGLVRQATFVRKCGLPDWSRWLPDEARSGGAILDLMVHDIDQILLLFGMPERVTAKRIGNSDSIMASFLYKGGPEVRLQGGWFAAGMPFAMSFQVRSDGGEMELGHDGLFYSDMSGTKSKVEVETGNAYATEVHYFLDCCRDGVEPTLCLPADSANAVRVALALKESRAKDGEQIRCLA